MNSFEAEVHTFLKSVETRDWPTFKRYLDPEGELIAVLPNGTVHRSYEAFLTSQREYFEGKTSSFTSRVETVLESGNLGFATILATYEDTDAKPTPFQSLLYITFLFSKAPGGRWYLIHDQNTLLERKSLNGSA